MAYIASDFATMVCDRRLTLPGPPARVAEDDAVKAVVWNYRAVFTYTGLAWLPRSPSVAAVRDPAPARQPTNIWLAEVLSLGDAFQDCLEHLQSEAQRALREMRAVPEALRRQAFLAVAWLHIDGGPLEPVIVDCHNFRDGRTFPVNVTRLGTDYACLSSLELPRRVATRHERALRDCHDRGLGADAVGRVLVYTVREVADRNIAVGRGVLEVSVPRRQVEAVEDGGNWALGAGNPNPGNATFRYFPAGSDTGFAHGPTLTLEDKSILSQINFAHGVGPVEVNRSVRQDQHGGNE
jgi:hypothetical protein